MDIAVVPVIVFSLRHSQSCFTNLNGIGTTFSAFVDPWFTKDTAVYFDNVSARSCGIWWHFIASVMVCCISLVSRTSTAILFYRFLVGQSAHLSKSVNFNFRNMGDEVSRSCLINLALDLSGIWMKLARALALEDEVERIKEDNRGNVSEQAYRMLLNWKQRKGSLATLQVLGEALEKPTVPRKDLAQKYCKNNNPSSWETGKRFRKSSLHV